MHPRQSVPTPDAGRASRLRARVRHWGGARVGHWGGARVGHWGGARVGHWGSARARHWAVPVLATGVATCLLTALSVAAVEAAPGAVRAGQAAGHPRTGLAAGWPAELRGKVMTHGGLLAASGLLSDGGLLAPAESFGSAASFPSVAPLRRLREADVLVWARSPLSAALLRRVGSTSGVQAGETVDVGRLSIGRDRAVALGVDPSTFRAYTPRLTAASDPLWRSVARGELTASFDMGRDARLPLGATLAVRGTRTAPTRIGAFASVGMAGIDAVVSRAQAAALGLPAGNGVVVSAPHADPAALQQALRAELPRGTRVEILREVVVVRDAGEFLTRDRLSTVLHAAWSRIGRPYVWGATGPDSFDCSGLVQWSYARAGILLPRTAAEQWFAGPHVPLSDAMPGDLLFWTYDPTAPGFIDHVAIYIGNGMMVVAPHTGLRVQVSPVPLAHLAGVVRVDPALVGQAGASLSALG